MILTQDAVIRKVLSQANAEQNQHYPPHIADEHFNLVTECLIDESAKSFPGNQAVIEIIKPFLKVKDVKVKNGVIALQEDHRHLFGIFIFINPDIKCACDRKGKFDEAVFAGDPLAPKPEDVERARLKKRSVSKKVTIVTQDRWDYLTNHQYKKPTLEKPIACMFEGEGVRVFPFDVPMVELTYVRDPKVYRYGYEPNSDDTYSYNPKDPKAVESEWTTNASMYLFKGMNTLYSNWVDNPDKRIGSTELKQLGLF